MYDRDESGYLNAFELRQALNSAGYRLNNHILNILVHRYGTKDGKITFDDYIMCTVRLKTMIGKWNLHLSNNLYILQNGKVIKIYKDICLHDLITGSHNFFSNKGKLQRVGKSNRAVIIVNLKSRKTVWKSSAI